jgi:hypothetical protein
MRAQQILQRILILQQAKNSEIKKNVVGQSATTLLRLAYGTGEMNT